MVRFPSKRDFPQCSYSSTETFSLKRIQAESAGHGRLAVSSTCNAISSLAGSIGSLMQMQRTSGGKHRLLREPRRLIGQALPNHI